jgi:hypothetical protein
VDGVRLIEVLLDCYEEPDSHSRVTIFLAGDEIWGTGVFMASRIEPYYRDQFIYEPGVSLSEWYLQPLHIKPLWKSLDAHDGNWISNQAVNERRTRAAISKARKRIRATQIEKRKRPIFPPTLLDLLLGCLVDFTMAMEKINACVSSGAEKDIRDSSQ